MRTDYFLDVPGSFKVAKETFETAYSADMFSFYEWQKTTAALMKQGFTAEETATILCSKITRHARDAYAEESEGKAQYVLDYIEAYPNTVGRLFEEKD